MMVVAPHTAKAKGKGKIIKKLHSVLSQSAKSV